MNITTKAQLRRAIKRQERSGRRVVVEGASFPINTRWPLGRVNGVIFRRCSFPATIMTSWFLQRREFTDCEFDEVDFDGIICNGVRFNRCRFWRVHFGCRVHNLIRKCQFRECSFGECLWNGSNVETSIFDHCTLGIAGDEMLWRESYLRDVIFVGYIKSTNFIQCKLENVDFRRCEFKDFAFASTTIRMMKFPDSPSCFLLYPAEYNTIIKDIKPVLSQHSFEKYQELAKIYSTAVGPDVVTDDNFEDIPAEERQIILNYLYKHRIREKTYSWEPPT